MNHQIQFAHNSTAFAIGILLLIALAFFLYFPVLWFGYISDDFALVPMTFEDALHATLTTVHFRPLWYASYPLVNLLFGGSSYVHHGVNIGLHILNCIVAVTITRKFLGGAYATVLVISWTLLPWVAFPIAWISQRNDLLMGLFILLAIHFSTSRQWWLSYTSTILAFLSKVTSLFFPLAFCFQSGLRRRPADVIFGVVVFLGALTLSLVALRNNVPSEHLQDSGPLLKFLNHAKNFGS